MAIEIENRVREKLGVVPRVGGAPVGSAAGTSAATTAKATKASKLVAAEPDLEDEQ
jgi:hypothetical protein